jgi:DNA-binding NarL/FixJ family response regulator
MITVAVAEDHALVREGLKALLDLQPDIEVVAEAGDGVQAWRWSPATAQTFCCSTSRCPG